MSRTAQISLGKAAFCALVLGFINPIAVQAAERWTPDVNATWQWQLRGEKINTDYDVTAYDIDLFNFSADTMDSLKNQEKKRICYFSAGSSEDWRSDYKLFRNDEKGKPLSKGDNGNGGQWEGERWLDIRSENVKNIMTARLDLAVKKGCDAVEPDNVDGYVNDTGFELTASDQKDYNIFLAKEAHKRNLAIALKNDVDQLAELEPWFDMAVNEECHEQSECAGYSVFTRKNKPVFNAEYNEEYITDPSAREALCKAANKNQLHTLVLPLELDDSFRYSCG
ncbi:endo alpha-1,4 polygalactosaminidase [Serratia sp. PAMC26656]|uniref:endo alpha-1,4 polygalactosaminidase n=1 Tax=Serratia sp. PAMC26656 TaxID=2775909 RepID=UPI0018F56E49|nr:endo alpha-1,4 polygalactosaminidase [Serratia sp. PAMC26656]MBJ7890225.1 endo alpha-1,4 polygalactosaminidase [Serratia sp. PAMC26656]